VAWIPDWRKKEKGGKGVKKKRKKKRVRNTFYKKLGKGKEKRKRQACAESTRCRRKEFQGSTLGARELRVCFFLSF